MLAIQARYSQKKKTILRSTINCASQLAKMQLQICIFDVSFSTSEIFENNTSNETKRKLVASIDES